jgi:DNA-binding transcriptional ArsR family regulator
MEQIEIFKALANNSRLNILLWLKDPENNFPGQSKYGFEHGVCVGQIQRAGLVKSTRVGQWTYYQRNEEAFASLSQLIQSEI